VSAIDDQKIKKLIHKIGLLNNLSDEEVTKIVSSQWEFAADKLAELNEKINNATDYQDVENIPTVFMYKSLCKLYICKYRLESLINRRKHINKINKKND
jgi:serine/threonine protein phosphatase PrpC